MMRMKWIGLAGFLLASACPAKNLILNETFGLAEKVEVRSYDVKTQTVRVESGSGLSQQSLSSFSDELQQHILAWVADESFMRSGIRVEIQKKKSFAGGGSVESTVWHAITLKNRADMDFENVSLECVTFFEARDGDLELIRFMLSNQGVNLKAGESFLYETKRMGLRDTSTSSTHWSGGSSGNGNTDRSTVVSYSEDKLLGIYVRISKVDCRGDVIQREFKDGRIPREDKWLGCIECTPKMGLAAPEGAKSEEGWESPEDQMEWILSRRPDIRWEYAYDYCRHYSLFGDVNSAEYWARQARELFDENPSVSNYGYQISDLDQFVSEAKEVSYPSFFYQ